ncbi:hypothetical protein [Streptomyces hydrogenans]|uniref:hypothetical protein n=1 Tax=Streptomyces hydrogenans TaxID=1873719 RepID=UPI00167D77B3|nr:hypothetical protein [Streptomyces hydrogenans]
MSTPLLTPTDAEKKALLDARNEEEIRLLVAQMQKAGALGFDPSTHVKGVITAVSYASSPPTVSLQISGDTTTTITGVRIMNNFTPVTGQTVDIRKQGADIVITGHTADVSGTARGQVGSGWIKATLTNGSHNGNSNGDVYYRLKLDDGSWKVQWQGGWAPEGSSIMIDSGQALPERFWPKALRSVPAARQVSTATSVVFDFHTDGRVVLTGHTYSTSASTVSGDVSFVSIGGSGFTSVNGSHTHIDGGGFATTTSGGHDHSVNIGASHDHGFYGGAHTHTAFWPAWVSLNGVEYFL